MSLLFIGQTTYDMIMSTQGRIEENMKKRALDRVEMLGGPATCACGVCSKWGSESYLLSRIGDDFVGLGLFNELNKYQINTKYVKRLTNAKSAFSNVIISKDNGNRTIFNDAGDLREEDFEVPSDVSIMLFDGHEVEACKKAVKLNPQAIKILDGGSVRKETLELVRLVDYLVCSKDFADQYHQKPLDINDFNDIKACFKELHGLCPNVVITLGDQGVLYEDDGQIKHINAYKVAVKDTTGAGDVFHGAFIYGLNQKWPMEKILKTASATSALSITKIGGIASIPSLNEVELFMREH